MLMNVGEGKWLGGLGVWFCNQVISPHFSNGSTVLKLLMMRFKIDLLIFLERKDEKQKAVSFPDRVPGHSWARAYGLLAFPIAFPRHSSSPLCHCLFLPGFKSVNLEGFSCLLLEIVMNTGLLGG